MIKMRTTHALEVLKSKQKKDQRYWVGVDLDGTIAKYTEWKGWKDIGDPIPMTIKVVKKLIELGVRVKIFTARVSKVSLDRNDITLDQMTKVIQDWCEKNIGVRLPVTCEKDCYMVFCIDDYAIQVETNTGKPVVEDGFDRFKDKIEEISENEETDDGD